jgi:peptidoglycan-associated lipoprotein
MKFSVLVSSIALGAIAISACAHQQAPRVVEQVPACPAPQAAPVQETATNNPPPCPTCPSPKAPDCAAEVRNVLQQTVLHFDFDRAELTPLNRKFLEQLADALQACPVAHVVIAGNCDERGTEEYNLALGQRRAAAAKRYLQNLGVAGERIDTISYGLERPADDRHNEEAWAMNRRDEFSLKGVAITVREGDPEQTQ